MKTLTASFTHNSRRQIQTEKQTSFCISLSLALSLFPPSIFKQPSLHHIKRQQSSPDPFSRSLSHSLQKQTSTRYAYQQNAPSLSAAPLHWHTYTNTPQTSVIHPIQPYINIYIDIFMKPLLARLSVPGMLKGTQRYYFSANFPLMFLSIAALNQS